MDLFKKNLTFHFLHLRYGLLLNRGFTLIELIIVMAVLGILAAGLLAALDPIEQVRRAGDNGARTTANEILRASHRYFAATQSWPANIAALATAGELKKDLSSFVSGGTTYTMSFAIGNNSVAGWAGPFVCFTPIKSKSMNADDANNYSSAGNATTDPVQAAAGTFYCVKSN